MSEYQYYEFQAVDHPLTPAQMDELRNYSSRAQITPRSFINEYNWGDFKGSPDRWMEKYFDGFLYLTNWGTRRVMFRVPEKLLLPATIMEFSADECFSYRAKNDQLILSFYIEEADDEWVDGEGWLDSLIQLRTDLMRGDYRCLYLGWLLAVQEGEFDGETLEPAVPPGLGDLSGSLESLADFLCIDPGLIEVAAERSGKALDLSLSKKEITGWVAGLSPEEKDGVIESIIEHDDLHSAVELRQRAFLEIKDTEVKAHQPQDKDRRTVEQLLGRAEQIHNARRKEEAERILRERARRVQEKAERRRFHLESLFDSEETLWIHVNELIATTRPKSYDQAVSLLKDLRDVAEMRQKNAEFSQRMDSLRDQYTRKPSLQRRLRMAGLLA